MLNSNGTLFSANGRFRFIYQDDTNLVLYRTTDNVGQWDTRPKPGGVGVCIMQEDGNLVVYNARGEAVWASDTPGNPGARLVVQNDGNAVIYRPDGVAAWATWTGQQVPPTGADASGHSVMESGEQLAGNGTLYSADGRFRFVYQDDTNLVLYRRSDDLALWDTRPKPGGVGVCVMQTDGNLVVYNAAGQAVWASDTDGEAGARLVMQDDGNAVIYRPDGVAVWATGTQA
ncbi:hypothetical protein [Winogradskya humida]|uniref:Bulb-type lectin domain-containing protein n=1 Tax=Winogradskya humida TaxID=113566 RepID=A0ABQ3ZZW7_9ACTN|nr:hypothetical protein [Actinoplanes humidus]GIE23647.1 hypothetical protein Ahu01nite_067490 [Actinoplanes humidus]